MEWTAMPKQHKSVHLVDVNNTVYQAAILALDDSFCRRYGDCGLTDDAIALPLLESVGP